MYDGPLSGAALTQRVQTMLVGPAAGSAELPPLEVDQGDTGDGRSHFHPLATCTVRRAGTSKATDEDIDLHFRWRLRELLRKMQVHYSGIRPLLQRLQVTIPI